VIVRPANGPVQLTPPGLLGLLQLKTGGFVPDALLQSVQPTLDLLPFWLRAAAENFNDSYSVVIPGPATPTEIVPLTDAATHTLMLGPTAQEWWYVENLSVGVSTSGATTPTCCLGYVLNGGPVGGVTSQYVSNFVRPVAGEAPPLVARDFWVPPGGVIGVYVDTFLVSFDLVLTGLRYTRCAI